MLFVFVEKLPAVTSGLRFFWLNWLHFLSDQSCQQTVKKERGTQKKHHAWNEADSLHLSVCISSWKSGTQRQRWPVRPAVCLHSDSTRGKMDLMDTDSAVTDLRHAGEKAPETHLIAFVNIAKDTRDMSRRRCLWFKTCRWRSYPLELRAFLSRLLTDIKK